MGTKQVGQAELLQMIENACIVEIMSVFKHTVKVTKKEARRFAESIKGYQVKVDYVERYDGKLLLFIDKA